MKIKNWLWPSIILTVLTSFLFGLLGIYFSVKTDQFESSNDLEKARKYSRYAGNCFYAGLVVLIIQIFLALLIFPYNHLIDSEENVKKSWNNVQSDYQRRSDLIPNLVNTVKGAANFEQQTLVQLMDARAKATSVNVNADDLTPEKLAEFQAAQVQVNSGIGRLLAVVENYPDLKANQNFRDLQVQLEGTENRIKVARNDFNSSIQIYNVYVRSFPSNIAAKLFGFKIREGFKADPGSDRTQEVKF